MASMHVWLRHPAWRPSYTEICPPSPTISTSCGPGGIQVRQFSGSKGRSAIDLWKHNMSLQTLVGSFQGVYTIVDTRHAAKNWDTKNANVVTVHPFLWETIAGTSMAKSKTISFLGFSTSPENTPHQILSSASSKLREAAPTSLLNQCFGSSCWSLPHPKKKNWSVFRIDLWCRKSMFKPQLVVPPYSPSGCPARFRNPPNIALVDFRNQEVHL